MSTDEIVSAAGGVSDQPGRPVVSALPRYTGPREARQLRGGSNGLATAAMILGIVPVFLGILGIILGFVALDQIKESGQSGRGNALTGIIAGFMWLSILPIVLLSVLL